MADDATVAEPEQVGVGQTIRDMPTGGRFALLGAFINQFGAFVQLFLVIYLTVRGFSKQEAGLALGAYAVGAILGTVFGGGLSDRLGPRWTIVVSVGSAGLFTAAITVLHPFAAIIAAVILSGAMTQAARPAVSALLFGLVPKARQTMVFAMYTTAINAGAIAGPLMAVWLSTISWNLVFWFDGATALTYSAVAAFLVPADRIAPVAEPADGPAAPRSGYRTLLHDHRYLAYLSLMLANGLVHIQFYVVLPLMLIASGYHPWVYGTATAISAAIVVGANMIVTTTTQKWPSWVAVITGWTLLVIGRGAFGLPGGLIIVIAATIVAAIGQVIGGPAAFAYPAKVAPPEALGRYIGSAHATFQTGYAIGPIVGVLLWNSLGRSFWAICFGFGLAMIIPGIWGMRPAGDAEMSPRADVDDPVPAQRADGDPSGLKSRS
jgi:MFS family permease